MKGQIYHVDIVVSNFSESAKFYDEFLGGLGYRRIFGEKEEAGWGIIGCNVWVSQCKERFVRRGYHRKRVGLNHVAFHADSREMVDGSIRNISCQERSQFSTGGRRNTRIIRKATTPFTSRILTE